MAEEFPRSGELEHGLRIFQKTLETDPENFAMKVRLAEVFICLKKKDEAWRRCTTSWQRPTKVPRTGAKHLAIFSSFAASILIIAMWRNASLRCKSQLADD